MIVPAFSSGFERKTIRELTCPFLISHQKSAFYSGFQSAFSRNSYLLLENEPLIEIPTKKAVPIT